MRLDKGNILKPTPGLYLIPIKSYKQKRINWLHDVIIWPQMTFPEVKYAKLHRGHQQ